MTDLYTESDKEELAFGYVHGLLDQEDKKRVFELVLSDPEFTRLLREELLLYRTLQASRKKLSPRKKQELLRKIKQSHDAKTPGQIIAATALKSILRMTMPPVAYRTLITFKGDVL